MVLRHLPPDRLAPPTTSTPTRPARQNRHHLPMPPMRNPLPRRATLPRLQHLVPQTRPRRTVPTLPRTRRRLRPHRRQPIRTPTTLQMNTKTTRPATPKCGLNPNRTCREESETPHLTGGSVVRSAQPVLRPPPTPTRHDIHFPAKTGYRTRLSDTTHSQQHRAGEGLPSSRRHYLNVPHPIRRRVHHGCHPGSTPLPWPSP